MVPVWSKIYSFACRENRLFVFNVRERNQKKIKTYVWERKRNNVYPGFNHRSPKSACIPALMLNNMPWTQGYEKYLMLLLVYRKRTILLNIYFKKKKQSAFCLCAETIRRLICSRYSVGLLINSVVFHFKGELWHFTFPDWLWKPNLILFLTLWPVSILRLGTF